MELCILHLAMSEIEVLGTSHRIVINEVGRSYLSTFMLNCTSHTSAYLCNLTICYCFDSFFFNKAVDLAKRFCDGAAPRIINGCLRTYVKDHGDARVSRVVIESNKDLV